MCISDDCYLFILSPQPHCPACNPKTPRFHALATLRCRHGGKTADWLLISRVFLLSADLSAAAQQSLKNYELFTTITQQIRQAMQK